MTVTVYTGEVEGTRRPEGEVEVEIPQGAGTARIASILEEAGAIGNTYLFRYYSNKYTFCWKFFSIRRMMESTSSSA